MSEEVIDLCSPGKAGGAGTRLGQSHIPLASDDEDLARAIALSLVEATAVSPSGAASEPSGGAGAGAAAASPVQVSALSFNLWFKPIHEAARMASIVACITKHMPDIIGLQEVTAANWGMLKPALTALGYRAYVDDNVHRAYGVVLASRHGFVTTGRRAFKGSIMGRCLLYGYVRLPSDHLVLAGTSHLESPIAIFNSMSPAEKAQAAADNATSKQQRPLQLADVQQFMDGEASCYAAAVFMADTNWGKVDGEFAKNAGWVDAWEVATTVTPASFWNTYDGMLNTLASKRFKNRLDRILVRPGAAGDISVPSFTGLGTKPLAGLLTPSAVYGPPRAVYPSDHFGVAASVQFGASGPPAVARGAPKPAPKKSRKRARDG